MQDTQTSLDLSIVIVSWNTESYLRECLSSIFEHTEGLSYEVWVVDNASSDGSVRMVEEEFPRVRVLANPTNVGFARANNQALRQCGGRYVLLLNSDTCVQGDVLRVMVDFMDHRPDAGISGCKLQDVDGTFQPACRRSIPTPVVSLMRMTGLSRLFPNSRIMARYNLTYQDATAVQEVDCVSGAFLLMRRETMEQIGLLDEDYFLHGEDLDWCYRAKRAGWQVYFVPYAAVTHFKGKSSERVPVRTLFHLHRSMGMFYRKHFARTTLFIVNGLVYTAIWGRFLFAIGARPLRTPILADIGMIVIAFYLAYLVRFDFALSPGYRDQIKGFLPMLLLIRLASMYAFGVYRRLWRYATTVDLLSILQAGALGTLMLSTVMFLREYHVGLGVAFGFFVVIAFGRTITEGLSLRRAGETRLALPITLVLVGLSGAPVVSSMLRLFAPEVTDFGLRIRSYLSAGDALSVQSIPRSVLLLEYVFYVLFIGGVRFPARLFREYGISRVRGGRRVLIVGADDTGELVLREIRKNRNLDFDLIGFVDDDRRKRGKRVHGVEILGSRDDLSRIVRDRAVTEVIVSGQSARERSVRALTRLCDSIGVTCRIVPSLQDLINGRIAVHSMEDSKSAVGDQQSSDVDSRVCG